MANNRHVVLSNIFLPSPTSSKADYSEDKQHPQPRERWITNTKEVHKKGSPSTWEKLILLKDIHKTV